MFSPAVAPFLMAIAASISPQGAPVGIAQWVNIEAIQLLTHHTSAVVAAVVLFWFVGWLIRRILDDSLLKRIALLLDELVLLCIFAYFAYELLFLLYLRTRELWPS